MSEKSPPRLLASAPVLLVRDVIPSADYFRDKLGFTVEDFYGEPPSFCILKRDHLYVMLKTADDPAHVVPNWKLSDKLWDIYFWVDDVEAIYAEMKERGAIIDYELCDQPYGVREFGVQDIDDHDIAFGQGM